MTKEVEQTILGVVGKKTKKTKEDESFFNEGVVDCPYKKCNGSGLIKINNSNIAEKCDCLKEKIMIQKLKNSNINTKYLDKEFDYYDNETSCSLYVPLETPIEFKKSPRIDSVRKESYNNFVKRNYKVKKSKRSVKDIFESYAQKNVSLLESGENGVNLMLFGDPANGKTSFAIAIGIFFLKNERSVYFSTVQNLIDNVFDEKEKVEKISREVDLLILDELFNEYHSSNSSFAQKRLMEVLKIREELGLVTIFTSNGTPKDFYLLYGKSFMSLLNGTFFIFELKREVDGRVQKMLGNFDKFNL